jgi:transcriptional regulator with XRE-family HTH domain
MSPARIEPDTRFYSGMFAERLRMLRERAGLTVEDMSEESGIPISTIYNWESGRTEPYINAFPVLADVLGVKIRTLLPKEYC